MSKQSNDFNLPQIQAGMMIAGRYRILSRIGKGGMGYVYAAQEESLGLSRMVAIKVLPPQLMLDESLLARFREEIKIASALDHPHIVPIYSLGEHRGIYFYVMKLLDGQTAYQKLRKYGPFTEADTRRTLAPIADALHYTHKKGVIHRDIKSNNIHINQEGFPTLMDFGIARMGDSTELTSPGQVVGTAECMAPEQWYGEAEPRSDIYSLGVVIFELLTGRLPFRAKHAFELMKMHQEVQPPSPRTLISSLSPELEQIILRCMAKDPEARFASAKDVAEHLAASYQPVDQAALAESPILKPETGGAAPPTAETVDQNIPTVELTPQDKKVWDFCVAADGKYAAGDLTGALKLIDRAMRLAPSNPQVSTRSARYAKMKELAEKIISRADHALGNGNPQVSVKDYTNILRVIPIPVVADKLAKAERQIAEAEQLVKQARQARNAGKYEKSFELAVAAKKLNHEIENDALLAPPPRKSKTRPLRKWKMPKIFTTSRVVTALIIAALLGLVFGARPALLAGAEQQFQQQSNDALFLSRLSAHRLYSILEFVPGAGEVAEARLVEINARAKSYYVENTKQAIGRDDYAAAIGHLKKAMEYDPLDSKLRDWLELYETKLQVKQSMN